MRYFKDDKNEVFAYEDSDWVIKDLEPVNKWLKDGLKEIDESEAKQISEAKALAERQAYEQSREGRIAILKAKLHKTDFKAMPDYDKDNTAILAERQAWREEVRKLEDGE